MANTNSNIRPTGAAVAVDKTTRLRIDAIRKEAAEKSLDFVPGSAHIVRQAVNRLYEERLGEQRKDG